MSGKRYDDEFERIFKVIGLLFKRYPLAHVAKMTRTKLEYVEMIRRKLLVQEVYLDDPYEDTPELEKLVGIKRRKIPVAFSPTGKRRLIDPTTCERDYGPDEIEFMKAVEEYKRDNRRPFPTWSEIMEVFKGLGYQKP